MPSLKKAPSLTRKNVTDSARAMIWTQKIQKDTRKDLNESYIQPATQPQVSTMTSSSNVDPAPITAESSKSILSRLTELFESYRAMLSRMKKSSKGSL